MGQHDTLVGGIQAGKTVRVMSKLREEATRVTNETGSPPTILWIDEGQVKALAYEMMLQLTPYPSTAERMICGENIRTSHAKFEGIPIRVRPAPLPPVEVVKSEIRDPVRLLKTAEELAVDEGSTNEACEVSWAGRDDLQNRYRQNHELCRALGLDPTRVTKIEIVVDHQGARLRVDYFMSDAKMKSLISAIKDTGGIEFDANVSKEAGFGER